MSIQRALALMLIVVACGRTKERSSTRVGTSQSDSGVARVPELPSARAPVDSASRAATPPLDSGHNRANGTSRPSGLGRTQRDSIRGIVALSGPAPAPIVSLILKDGGSVRLVSSHPLATVRQLNGLEIVAYTKRRGRPDEPVDMEDFAVRAVGADAAVDGILRRAPSGDVVELRDGRRLPIRGLPDYMHDADGKRVWIAGPLDAPISAGVIDPNRRSHFPE